MKIDLDLCFLHNLNQIIHFDDYEYYNFNRFDLITHAKIKTLIKSRILDREQLDHKISKLLCCYICKNRKYCLNACSYFLPTKSQELKRIANLISTVKLTENLAISMILDSYLVNEYFKILDIKGIVLRQEDTYLSYETFRDLKLVATWIYNLYELPVTKFDFSRRLKGVEKSTFLVSCLNHWGVNELQNWITLLSKNVNDKVILKYRGDLISLIDDNKSIDNLKLAFKSNPISLIYADKSLVKNEKLIISLLSNMNERQLLLKTTDDVLILSTSIKNVSKYWSSEFYQRIIAYLREEYNIKIN